MSTQKTIATIAKVIDSYDVVINKGSESGIKMDDKFLVYELSEDEIIDPESGDSLGRLEIVKGRGRVIHLQEKIATLRTDKTFPSTRTIRRKSPLSTLAMLGSEVVEEQGTPELDPFDDPKVGDKAKPV